VAKLSLEKDFRTSFQEECHTVTWLWYSTYLRDPRALEEEGDGCPSPASSVAASGGTVRVLLRVAVPVEAAAAAAEGIFPLRRGLLRIPSSGFNEGICWSDAGHLEEELRLIHTSGVATGAGTSTSTTARCPCGVLAGCSGFRSVAGGIHVEVPGPFPNPTWPVTRRRILEYHEEAATTASVGDGMTRAQEAAGRKGLHRGFTRGRLERRHRNPLNYGHRLQSDLRGGDRVGNCSREVRPTRLAATSGVTLQPTSMAKSMKQIICLYTVWVIKLTCCCWVAPESSRHLTRSNPADVSSQP